MIREANEWRAIVEDPATTPADRAYNLEGFKDQIRNLDLMRQWYGVFGKAF
jgi:hypothetical protein